MTLCVHFTESLDLSHTGFSGTIPSTLGDLSNLQFLALDYITDLTGTVPTELGRLSNLGELGGSRLTVLADAEQQ